MQLLSVSFGLAAGEVLSLLVLGVFAATKLHTLGWVCLATVAVIETPLVVLLPRVQRRAMVRRGSSFPAQALAAPARVPLAQDRGLSPGRHSCLYRLGRPRNPGPFRTCQGWSDQPEL